jgi:serine-type D-Ala-D-Ala carboxypeptidase
MADVFIRAWQQAYPGVVPDAIIAALDHDQTARTGGPAPRLTVTYQELPGRSAEVYPVVSQLLIRQLAGGVPPGLAMEVRSSAATAYSAAGGWAKLTGSAADADLVTSAQGPVEVGAGTLFDLASLTKVIATLPLVLLLHQRGEWSIDDPVARWLPGAPRSPVTISDCLLHIAGLVPFRQYYLTCDGPAEIKRAVTAELAGAAAGPVSYSDVGFMLLGWAIENCAGETLAGLFAREVAGPLGMTSTSYLPEAPRQHIAATEADGDQRTNPVLVWGEVHDGNAFALGGTSGHAGLFGTAADLGRFASALLRPDHHPVLSAETIALMTSRHTGADPEARVLGWRVRPDQWGSWPAGTIWHTGFTGTSMLIAPALDAAIVLLTNAVHPARRGAEIAEFRTKVHQAVRTLLDGSPGPDDTGMPAAESSSARSRS